MFIRGQIIGRNTLEDIRMRTLESRRLNANIIRILSGRLIHIQNTGPDSTGKPVLYRKTASAGLDRIGSSRSSGSVDSIFRVRSSISGSAGRTKFFGTFLSGYRSIYINISISNIDISYLY